MAVYALPRPCRLFAKGGLCGLSASLGVRTSAAVRTDGVVMALGTVMDDVGRACVRENKTYFTAPSSRRSWVHKMRATRGIFYIFFLFPCLFLYALVEAAI